MQMKICNISFHYWHHSLYTYDQLLYEKMCTSILLPRVETKFESWNYMELVVKVMSRLVN
jgi:hypothetical protein